MKSEKLALIERLKYYLIGAGSILNLFGNYYPKIELGSIEDDWETVCNDFNKVFNK